MRPNLDKDKLQIETNKRIYSLNRDKTDFGIIGQNRNTALAELV